jgi:hypothetical protein
MTDSDSTFEQIVTLIQSGCGVDFTQPYSADQTAPSPEGMARVRVNCSIRHGAAFRTAGGFTARAAFDAAMLSPEIAIPYLENESRPATAV